MIVAVAYVLLFIACFAIASFVPARMRAAHDFTSLKTVTFGDESAVRPDRIGSVLSVLVIFLLWAVFTGSSLLPFSVPGPFTGETRFTYTVEGPDGATEAFFRLELAGRVIVEEKQRFGALHHKVVDAHGYQINAYG